MGANDWEHPCAIVLRGPSQTGKSTFLNDIMLPGEGSRMLTGDGSGESVTQETSLRRTLFGLVMDGPGDNDSMLRFTNEEAGTRYALALAKAHVQRVKFLVFESVVATPNQLRASLASLVSNFGNSVMPGVVVIASQCDRADAFLEKRLMVLRDIIFRANGSSGLLSELVLWQHTEDPELMDKQLKMLKDALEKTPGVDMSALTSLWDRQRQRAQELCDMQPKRTRLVDVPEDFVVGYTTSEEYEEQEPYQETEEYIEQVKHQYKEQYQIPEPYQEVEVYKVSVVETHEKPSCCLATLCGRSRFYEETVQKSVPVVVTKFRLVPSYRDNTTYIPEKRYREVTKYRPVKRVREVERFKTETRIVSKAVEYALPLCDFEQLALDQILTEIRFSFAHSPTQDTPLTSPCPSWDYATSGTAGTGEPSFVSGSFS